MTGKKKTDQESNATKATKLIEEFLKKVSQGPMQRTADNTALSGSVKDESHDDPRLLSNISLARGRNSRKSL